MLHIHNFWSCSPKCIIDNTRKLTFMFSTPLQPLQLLFIKLWKACKACFCLPRAKSECIYGNANSPVSNVMFCSSVMICISPLPLKSIVKNSDNAVTKVCGKNGNFYEKIFFYFLYSVYKSRVGKNMNNFYAVYECIELLRCHKCCFPNA